MIRFPKPGWLVIMLSMLIGCHQPIPSDIPDDLFRWQQMTGLPMGISFRGLCVVNDSILWASGNKGSILISEDGGVSWTSRNPLDNGHRDFRSIHAWNAKHAIAMAVGDTGLILRTGNGGSTWDTVYIDPTPGVFLDDVAFEDSLGWCYGDPVKGKLYVLGTTDSGRTWQRIDPGLLPVPVGTEGAFAASGTNVIARSDLTAVVTGAGQFPRFLSYVDEKWSAIRIPLQSGPTAGAYSVAFRDRNFAVVVGGNFQDSTRRDSVACMTTDGGIRWEIIPETEGPGGYRSCVTWHPGWKLWFAVGRTGLDWSQNGKQWYPFGDLSGYYVCMPSNDALWCVGRNGKLGRLLYMAPQ